MPDAQELGAPAIAAALVNSRELELDAGELGVLASPAIASKELPPRCGVAARRSSRCGQTPAGPLLSGLDRDVDRFLPKLAPWTARR